MRSAPHLKADAARDARRFVGEIVPLRGNAEEARDQSAASPGLDDLEEMVPFAPPDGTLTPGNTSSLHDGAAFVVVVSEKVWRARKKPPALKFVLAAALGVAPGEDGSAPIEAMRKLYSRLNGFKREDIGVFELSESSAAQEIALAELLDLDPAKNQSGRRCDRAGASVGCSRCGARRAVVLNGLCADRATAWTIWRGDARRHRRSRPRGVVRSGAITRCCDADSDVLDALWREASCGGAHPLNRRHLLQPPHSRRVEAWEYINWA